MPSRVRSRERGFILTLELIFIITILLIGTFVGWVLIRDELFELMLNRERFTVKVLDDTGALVGPVVNYDLCETPQVLFRDPSDPDQRFAALVGVRPDRFVSRDRIYYQGPDCTGTAHIARPGDDTLPVGWLNADQGVSYGVGAPDTFPPYGPGKLYRSTATDTTPTIHSRWISLNPDCADTGSDTGGSTGELILNGDFEDPVIPVNGEFSPTHAPLPTAWAIAGGAGHWNPCLVGDATCATTPGTYNPPLPDGSQVAYSNGGNFSQQVALTAGSACTLQVSVGCRLDACAAGGSRTYTIQVTDPGASDVFAPLTGSIGPGSPEWQTLSQVFVVPSAGNHTLSLSGSAVQVNFDSVGLVCSLPATGPGPSAAICDNMAATPLGLSLAQEVLVPDSAPPVNLLELFTPPFRVPSPGPDVELVPIPPEPEGDPAAVPPDPTQYYIDVTQPPTPEGTGTP